MSEKPKTHWVDRELDIHALIPGSDWFAVYAIETDGKPDLYYSRIVAFAAMTMIEEQFTTGGHLVGTGEESYITIEAYDVSEGSVMRVRDTADFLSIEHKDDIKANKDYHLKESEEIFNKRKEGRK